MRQMIVNSCLVKSSQLGAKGFLYPVDDSRGMFVKKGIEVEILNYIAGENYVGWKAVSIPNSSVENAIIDEGVGVYWIHSKNLS